MSRTILLIASLAIAVVLLGCSKTETANDNKTSNEKSTTASTPATTTGTTASTGDKVGVPECDEFITKYDACVSNKVPEMVRAQYKDAIARWRSDWKKLANDPTTKSHLAATCKQIAEQQNAALKSFGCTF